jgi:hypothetical protein
VTLSPIEASGGGGRSGPSGDVARASGAASTASDRRVRPEGRGGRRKRETPVVVAKLLGTR